MPLAATVPSGPARDQVHAHALRPEVAREVARDGLERRPWRRPSSRRPARRPCASKSMPDDRAAGLHQRQQRRGQRLQRERARLERLRGALRRRLEELARRARPRARRRSRAGRRRRGPSARAGRRRRRCSCVGLVDVELEHVDRLRQPRGGALGHAAAPGRSRSARPRRPPPGPGAATSQAIESLVMTPVTSSALAGEVITQTTHAPARRSATEPSAQREPPRGSRAGSIDLVDVAGGRGGAGAEVLLRVARRRTPRAPSRGPRRRRGRAG